MLGFIHSLLGQVEDKAGWDEGRGENNADNNHSPTDVVSLQQDRRRREREEEEEEEQMQGVNRVRLTQARGTGPRTPSQPDICHFIQLS